jgi:hypothetical protein
LCADVTACDDFAIRRGRLDHAEAELARLQGRYDQLMNAFKFDEARALVGEIEAVARERAMLAADLPPPVADEAKPYAVARPRRRRGR